MHRTLLFMFPPDPRPRRVCELLLAIWLLSTADLAFTLWAHLFTRFHELNPLARALLENDHLHVLVAFKFVLTGTASVIFWRLRKRPHTEAALWALLAVYVMLTFRWSDYTVAAVAMSGGTL
jgi:hypothetical protein